MATFTQEATVWSSKRNHARKTVRTTLHPHSRGPVLRCRRDQERPDDRRPDDERRRFHLAWHGREATPSWGVADFRPVTPPGVTKAALLAWGMVQGASRRRADRHPEDPDASGLDLNADGRGDTDVEETRPRLPAPPEPGV
jgi:hypothetical protein